MTQRMTRSLPNGRQVEAYCAFGDELKQDGLSGYILRDLLAEDPDQPRKFFDEEQLEQITESIRTEGVRDQLVVTPADLAPWVKLKPEHEGRPLIIVSGNRRWIASGRAGINTVPFRIDVYENESDHRAAADLYNGPRADLSEIEEAYEMLRRRKAGATYERIALSKGKSVNYVIRRLSLTRLAPNIKGELEEEANLGKRTLAITVAEDLGTVEIPQPDELIAFADEFDLTLEAFAEEDPDSLRFALQNALLTIIRRERFSAGRAREFIQTRKRSIRSSGAHKRYVASHKPSRRMETLQSLISLVDGTPVQDWPKDEWDRVFHNASRESVEEIIGDLVSAKNVLDGIHTFLIRIAEKKKSVVPFRPEHDTGERRKPEEKQETETSAEHETSSDNVDQSRIKPLNPGFIRSWSGRDSLRKKIHRPHQHPPPLPTVRPNADRIAPTPNNGFTAFTTEVWNPTLVQYELTKIERRGDCDRIFAEVLFRFQREKIEPPDEFPRDLLQDRVEVA